jgi:hypothetical protein
MSSLNLNKKHKPEDVMPYLYNLFYNEIPRVAKPIKMYLVGSRGRLDFNEWEKLEGKDWDLLIEFDHYIRNQKKILNPEFNVDIMRCDTYEKINHIRNFSYKGDSRGFEIFPNTPEFLKKYIK